MERASKSNRATLTIDLGAYATDFYLAELRTSEEIMIERIWKQ